MVSREFEPDVAVETAPPPSSPEPTPFVLHPDLAVYVESCLAPLQAQVVELRTQLGEFNA
ncbi:MAG: hypothetical protein ACKPCM_04565 [Pseudanabaena sp.]